MKFKDGGTFIPLTLDNSTKQSVSNKQWVALACIIGGAVVTCFAVVKIYTVNHGLTLLGTPLFLVPCLIIIGLLAIILIRKLVLRESVLFKAFIETLEHSKTDLGIFCDIYAIDDKLIRYMDGSTGIIIRAEHGYMCGRPENHEDLHRKAIQKFLRLITDAGWDIRIYNCEEHTFQSNPLRITRQNLELEKNTERYVLGMQMLVYMEAFCKNSADCEVTYYHLLTHRLNAVNGLDALIADIKDTFKASLFSFVDVLEREEILRFWERRYGLDYINLSRLLENKFNGSSLELVTINEVVYAKANEVETVSEVASISEAEKDKFNEYMSWVKESEEDFIE